MYHQLAQRRHAYPQEAIALAILPGAGAEKTQGMGGDVGVGKLLRCRDELCCTGVHDSGLPDGLQCDQAPLRFEFAAQKARQLVIDAEIAD